MNLNCFSFYDKVDQYFKFVPNQQSVYFVFSIKKVFSAQSIQIFSYYSNGDKDVISP